MNPVIKRRAFICNAGAALSATVAATAAANTAATPTVTPPATDASNEIRQLHYTLIEHLNERHYTGLHKLFASDGDGDGSNSTAATTAEATPDVRPEATAKATPDATPDPRPRAEHPHRSPPAGTQHPVHDYIAGHAQHLDTIEIAPDQTHATARFHCLTRLEAALTSTHSLVEMARQQGQGALQWWESGVLENTYKKVASGWRITRLVFRSTGLWR